MFTFSQDVFFISGFAKPLANVTPSVVDEYVLSGLTDTEVPLSTIAELELFSNALTIPLSVCALGDWKYLRTPVVVLESSSFHETTVPLAVPPVTVCLIFSHMFGPLSWPFF